MWKCAFTALSAENRGGVGDAMYCRGSLEGHRMDTASRPQVDFGHMEVPKRR